jgi:hypothetical protein
MFEMDSELHTELQQIQSKLDQLLALKPIVERHDNLLFGNGNPGLVTRVDRMEQRAESHKWLLGLTIVAFFTAVGDWITRLWK